MQLPEGGDGMTSTNGQDPDVDARAADPQPDHELTVEEDDGEDADDD
jgi:hypothetical protein